MLKFLRKRENVKKIMWVLAVLIIPAFVLWGSGSTIRSGGRPKYAGRIFGKKISFPRYQAALLACRNQALLIYGEEFNKVAKYLNLEQEAWERLILLYQAKKERLEVSNKEVIDFIENLPLFQKQGRFNRKTYLILLDYAFSSDPQDFEEQIREALLLGKLKNKITSNVGLTAEETESVYKNENEKAEAFYVLIEPKKFEDQIHLSYEELQDYYLIHKAEFKKPEQVNVQYIALYFDRTHPEVEVDEEEMLNYYRRHLDEFSIKDKKAKKNIRPFEEVKAQIKEKLTGDKANAALEDKIWQISDFIGEDPALFQEAAEKFQEELKETGFFGPQEVIPEIGLSYEFLNAAFTLKIGQLSNIIETPRGYFIIKVKEKKDSYVPALEEIKEETKLAFVKEKSWQLAKEKGENLLSQIKKLIQEEKLNFSKAAEKLSLAIRQTEEFTRSSYISGIGQSPEFAQTAFAQESGEVSGSIRTPAGYCILSLKNIVPVEKERFAREKEEFAKELLARKKLLYYKNWLTELKKKANLISNIEKKIVE